MCLISPGAVRTPIWSKSGADAAALLAAAPAEAATLYGLLIRQVCAVLRNWAAHGSKDVTAGQRLQRLALCDRLVSPVPLAT